MKDQEFEAILHRALCPEIAPEDIVIRGRKSGKENHMNIKYLVKKSCIAAAVILLLTTTVYAADALNIRTLVSGGFSRGYETVEQAEERAGFEIDSRTEFSNGYAIAGIRVDETKGLDEKDKVRLTFKEIRLELKNAEGEKLSLTAYEKQDSIPETELPPDQTRRIAETVLCYRVDHYKFVPADYEQTEADRTWLQQPGNFMSYGSESVEETEVAFLTWEKDGIGYILMDSDADEMADSMFSMAEELILKSE